MPHASVVRNFRSQFNSKGVSSSFYNKVLAHKAAARRHIHLSRSLYATFACWPLVAKTKNTRLLAMLKSKELPSWEKIPNLFDNTGRRHILPVSVLMRVTSLVQENRDLFASQIVKDNLRVSSRTVSGMEAAGDSHDAGQHDVEELVKPNKEEVLEKEKKSKRNRKKCPATAETDEHLANNKRKRPNHFVAVQITNPEIHAVAKKIQAGIQETSTAKLRQAFVGVEKFHITLMVMHLSNKEEMQKAAESLEKCVPLILEKACGQPITLEFEGLSTFNNGRVLFASLKATEGLDHLHYMADEVAAQMKNNAIVSTDKPGKIFNPHLTLMKFDGDRELLRQGIKRVEASQYEPHSLWWSWKQATQSWVSKEWKLASMSLTFMKSLVAR